MHSPPDYHIKSSASFPDLELWMDVWLPHITRGSTSCTPLGTVLMKELSWVTTWLDPIGSADLTLLY